MPKTRITGFARLLLFLLVFLPAAFFGVSYYKGEDPVATLKGLFGGEQGAGPQEQYRGEDLRTAPATFENVQRLRDEITELRRRLAISEEKLARCQSDAVQ